MRRKFLKYRRDLQKKRSLLRRTGRNIIRHPVLLPAMTLLVLCTAAAVTLVVLNHHHSFKPPTALTVIISHDNEIQTVPTHEATVGALLAKLDIVINKGDVVEPSLSTPINQEDFRINVYRAVPVEIVDGTQRTFAFSAATTPRSIAEQAGITVYPEDYIYFVPVTNFVTQGTIGQEVIINPATPVNVNLYGTPTLLRTHATTVGQLLDQDKIKLGQNDSVQPAESTLLSSSVEVFVIHKGTQIQNVTQTIPMPMQVSQDGSLAYGTSAILQQGSPGQEVVTYQLNLQNGVVVSKTVLQTVVIAQPVTEIVAQGTNLSGIKGDMALAGIAPVDYQYADYIITHESGWCTDKLQGDIGYCPVSPPTYLPDDLGYGLCQATPGNKMSSAGSDWETDPVTQLVWCNGYANSKYGDWYNAYVHWTNYGSW
ncbi:MAG TPA: ubiquitin-like domain-containing protein [Candidatus Binatia bacterium]|nr:ubiquitin-like domain-containing protein [Candidatus Binatia bacterium]